MKLATKKKVDELAKTLSKAKDAVTWTQVRAIALVLVMALILGAVAYAIEDNGYDAGKHEGHSLGYEEGGRAMASAWQDYSQHEERRYAAEITDLQEQLDAAKRACKKTCPTVPAGMYFTVPTVNGAFIGTNGATTTH
jgi:hypothetical protein